MEPITILEDSMPFKAILDQITGFLTAPVTLARTGVQYYLGSEIGLKDRANEKIGVMRPETEVFNPDSVASFVNLVITDDHPNELVTINNVKNLQKGTVSHVKRDGEVLTGLITITDQEQIKKVEQGKVEVSVGYINTLTEGKGIHGGLNYEFVQTAIKANHLAIVDTGRCGPECKLTLDNEEVKRMLINIGGIEYDVEDNQLAQAIMKMQEDYNMEKRGLREELEKIKGEKEEEEKEKEKATATADALQGEKLSDEDINKLVAGRAVLLTDATLILGENMPVCAENPIEIKTAVVNKILQDMDLEGKSDEYITAAYDIAIEKFKKAKDSLGNLSQDFKDDNKNIVTRDSVRKKYMSDTLGLGGE